VLIYPNKSKGNGLEEYSLSGRITTTLMVLKQQTIWGGFGKEEDFDNEVNRFLSSGKKIIGVRQFVYGNESRPTYFAFITYEE
jgi:hypothetical protein